MTAWKDWTQEDWQNAVYCETCGLPLLEVPNEDNPNTGTYICIFCTWQKDVGIANQAQTAQLAAERDEWKTEAIRIRKQLEIAMLRWKDDATDGTMIDRRMLADINIALSQELAEWKSDAERLSGFYCDLLGYCGYCGKQEHSPDCPITLHRELLEKVTK